MPVEISPDYVGPMARWAMCLEDYPLADAHYELVAADQSDIPPRFWPRQGGEEVCKVTLDLHAGPARRSTYIAYRFPDKPASSGRTATDNTPDGWETWCTKTLGRALKDAGYPTDTGDVKLKLLWRQRNREMIHGRPVSAPEAERIVDGAARPAEDHVGDPATPTGRAPEPTGTPNGHAQGPTPTPTHAQQGQTHTAQGTPSPPQQPAEPTDRPGVVPEVVGRYRALSDDRRAKVDAFCEQRGWRDMAGLGGQPAKVLATFIDSQERDQARHPPTPPAPAAQDAPAEDDGRPFDDVDPDDSPDPAPWDPVHAGFESAIRDRIAELDPGSRQVFDTLVAQARVNLDEPLTYDTADKIEACLSRIQAA